MITGEFVMTAERSAPGQDVVAQACRYIEDNLDSAITLKELGDRCHTSPHHLQRLFKQATGITPRQYAEARRLERLKAQLRQGDNVTTALYEAGYGSSSRLYERAPSQLGMTPASYRRRGRGATIAFAMATTSLGRLLVAATERGICSVRLGDSEAALETGLRQEFAEAELRRDDHALRGWISALVAYLEGERPALSLPVDVQATAFQWRVWQELKAIPYGETRSYSEIARLIGRPRAARAVARACATNPVALVIPCHRVVREDGDLGGYRWGLERKQQLLAQESAHAGDDSPDRTS
jgi:AraC family transcriptional regulator of adaptative response/methylated-DNA-[protein]-cysteine methyltransferase